MIKRVCAFILLFLVLISSVNAASNESAEDNLKGIADALDEEKKTIEEKKWDYIGEKWKEWYLSNPVMQRVDSVLQKLNPVIRVVFGEDYNFSLLFFFVVLIWIVFFVSFSEIISTFGAFGKWVSILMGLIFTILGANLKIYNSISEFAFKVVFFKEGMWGWIFFIALVGLIIFYLSVSGKIARWFRNLKEKKEKKKREEQEKTDQKVLHKTVGAITGKK